MTTQIHITNLIPDYLLGLLPPHENRQVENHIHTCSVCRSALAEERQIGQAVRQTLAIVSRPDPGQLARLRPAPPQKSRFRPAAFFPNGQRLAAAALLILMIIAGAWNLYPGGKRPVNTNQQVVTAIAVTATREPTSTTAPATPEDAAGEKLDAGPSPTYEVFSPVETPVSKTSLLKTTTMKIFPVNTPPPAGTPVAALPVANQP